MIGGMSGVFAGAIGEGMSDVLAITINNDDIVGEYSYSDPVAASAATRTRATRSPTAR
jgi:hypothetical protein